MEPKPNKFWMVASHRGPSNVKYEIIEAAEGEAQRLARKHPGEMFFVVEAVSAFVTEEPPVTKLTWTN